MSGNRAAGSGDSPRRSARSIVASDFGTGSRSTMPASTARRTSSSVPFAGSANGRLPNTPSQHATQKLN